MVLRKPEAPDRIVPAPLSKAQPPYPTTPSEEHLPALPLTPPPAANAVHTPHANTPPAFHLKPPDGAKTSPDKLDVDSDFSEDEWGRSSDEDDFEEVNPRDVPNALRPAGGKVPSPAPADKNTLPDALRVGPPTGIPIRRSMDNISPMPTGASSASFGAMSTVSEQSNGSIPLQTNNPYLKIQTTGQSNWGGESSEAIWGTPQNHVQKGASPVELPAYQTPVVPTQAMQNLHVDSHVPPAHSSASPDQPPLIAVNSATPQSAQPKDSFAANPWAPDTEIPSSKPAATVSNLPAYATHQQHQMMWPEQQGWGQNERQHMQSESSTAQNTAARAEQMRHREEEPHRFEQAPPHVQPLTGPNPSYTEGHQASPPYVEAQPPVNVPQAAVPHAEEHPPALPPRRSHEEHPPTMPPRPIDTGASSSTAPGPESPEAAMNRQRKEHYQIKHIRWHDYNKQGIRTSPILTQNLNGPCPLLALVNALVLSTPPGVETALIETLRTRETVSLGLLLDAVFDELMSGRRGNAAQTLPDVSELYKFLLALHTGLNVNPLFVPDSSDVSGSITLTNRAGGFENTQDMKLYRTFDIPLMHGWLPEVGTEAYAAFDRVAKSYETSQYVQFQEEELDAKLQSGEALSEEEQQMFTDIHAIKEFLSRWPTQLTDHGLRVIRDNLERGQVAILFRNDHFSTLIKDPRTDQLVTLVTDQGYSTHDEIVWESLIDVNGQGSQLFSGDFRSVDNSGTSAGQQQQTQNISSTNDNQGWTTVPTRRPVQEQGVMHSVSQNTEITSPEGLSRAEQEDHDLALALQLQEEEEDRERRETEQRERDNQASVSAIAAQSSPRINNGGNRRTSRGEQAPVIPPRRNNVTTHRPAGEAAPPPTYEEASTTPRYNPPPGHPASAQAPFAPQGSAYQSTGAGLPPPQSSAGGRRHSGRMPQPLINQVPNRTGRRQSAGAAMNGNEEREKCVVM
ncbi:hypothetical protein T440DRAFT_465402 [Plenodomus tracheiphilus IPT5]|uniref:MINDY deubiquitinase domain-containing protein n=1 Tax=Plenodomus tracheiphilus IPT5 TaxID=1408161 RepID=A0A6A7BFZ2_9PLEO|nr:hypothetical protein T440DRAFT_465402 [Plenodomus tracheiphilus IPT5]